MAIKIFCDMPKPTVENGTKNPTIPIDPGAKSRFVRWLKSEGSPNQSAMLGKIVDWFVMAPQIAKYAMLRKIPTELESAAVIVLRQMADDLENKVKGPADLLLMEEHESDEISTPDKPQTQSQDRADTKAKKGKSK
jgi:hypothetical protein